MLDARSRRGIVAGYFFDLLNTVEDSALEQNMAKTTAKRPAAPAKHKEKEKARKPDKSHPAKTKDSHAPHAEKNSKADRVAAHREAAANAKARAVALENGGPGGNG